VRRLSARPAQDRLPACRLSSIRPEPVVSVPTVSVPTVSAPTLGAPCPPLRVQFWVARGRAVGAQRAPAPLRARRFWRFERKRAADMSRLARRQPQLTPRSRAMARVLHVKPRAAPSVVDFGRRALKRRKSHSRARAYSSPSSQPVSGRCSQQPFSQRPCCLGSHGASLESTGARFESKPPADSIRHNSNRNRNSLQSRSPIGRHPRSLPGHFHRGSTFTTAAEAPSRAVTRRLARSDTATLGVK